MTTQTTEQDIKYSFLKVRKEKESIILGINPTNKYQHEILKLAKSMNSIQNAGKGLLFTLNNSILEQLQLDEKIVVTNLNQLVYNQFLVQVLVFEYDTFNNALNVVPYFICHPSEEKTYTIYMMFDELIVYSYNAIKSYFDSRPVISREEFINELNWRYTHSDAYKGVTNLLNIFMRLESFSNGVTVYPEMVEYQTRELTRRILEAKMAIEISGQGLFMIKNSEVQTVFESAEEFMHESMIPTLLDDLNHRAAIEALLLEKKTYYEAEEFAHKTAKYTVALAKEIKSIKSVGHRNTYPGSIAIETIIRLEAFVEEKYQSLWKEDCDTVKKDFKKKINTPSSKWSQLITFIEHADTFKYPPNVWKELIADKEIFYIKWHTGKSTFHIFTGKEANIFKSLVVGMVGLPEAELWRAQALKHLIEKNERQLKHLLSDRNFMVVLNELTKKIYMPYVPWFLRFLLFLPFPALYEPFFNVAKSKIEEEQQFLAAKNDALLARVNAEISKNKSEMTAKIKEDFIYESLKKTLDSYYMKQKVVPFFDDLKKLYSDEDTLNRVIANKKFRNLSIKMKNGEVKTALIYPDDSEWIQKKSNLIRSFDSIVSDKNPHISMTIDKVKLETAQSFLSALNEDLNLS